MVLPPSPKAVLIWDDNCCRFVDGLSSNESSIRKIASICHDNLSIYDNFIRTEFQKYPIADGDHKITIYANSPHHPNNARCPRRKPGSPYEVSLGVASGSHYVENSFTTSLDIIAHELTHPFIFEYPESSESLNYFDQPGALTESICDVFGVMTMHYHEETLATEGANWTIGRGLYSQNTDWALRTMNCVKARPNDQQPKHARDYVYLNRDKEFGGVYINSGIPSHAFQIAAMKIGGYCWKAPGHVWVDALMKVKPDATFADFAQLIVDSDVINTTSWGVDEIRNIIGNAWLEVGITPGDDKIEQYRKKRLESANWLKSTISKLSAFICPKHLNET